MRRLLRRESLRLADAPLEQTLETLVAFLRAEQFAVITYNAVLLRVREPDAHDELARLKLSHAARALVLCERITEFGGESLEPLPDGLEPNGAFASVMAKVGAARDEWHAMAALREGECWAVRDYEIDLRDLDPHLRNELRRILLGEQRRTRGRLLRLVGRRAQRLFGLGPAAPKPTGSHASGPGG